MGPLESHGDPLIHFFRLVPAIALMTLIVWFGVAEISKILLITYATSFIVMIDTAIGVTAIPDGRSTPPGAWVEIGRSYPCM